MPTILVPDADSVEWGKPFDLAFSFSDDDVEALEAMPKDGVISISERRQARLSDGDMTIFVPKGEGGRSHRMKASEFFSALKTPLGEA